MAFFTIICLAIILFLVRIRDKSIINPVAITVLVWLFLLIGYNVIDHGLYSLSNKFYIAVLCWILPFFCAYTVTNIVTKTNKRFLIHNPSKLLTNNYFILFIALTLIITTLIKIREAQLYNPSNWYQAINTMANEARRGDAPRPSSLYIFLNRFAMMGYILCLIYIFRDIKFKYKNIFYLLVVIYVIFGANKLAILRIMFGYVAVLIYKKKLNWSKIIPVFLILLIGLYVLQLIRGGRTSDEFDLLRFLSIYFFSPLPAFDNYILQSPRDFTTYFHGEYTFKNLLGVVSLFDSKSVDPGNINFFNYDFVNVPLPTNVYTMLAIYFADWGWAGIIGGSIVQGCFWGYIYTRSLKSEVFKILYASIIYMLVFQFFYDYFSENIRFTLTIMIALFLLFYPPLFCKVEKK